MPRDTMKVLSLQAVFQGISLKKHIEKILEEKVEETYEDLVLLQLSSIPEANEWLSEEETAEFVKKLRDEVYLWGAVQQGY
ncbi:hypothetical protein EZS27_003473 [termite gut metagenome]|uniref:Uncharacterized protein n=1 Tax=termite gut metagenome TaxID=433724 RepID=A0A5J4SSS9_9ZZZZ